jgi:hypothetical protein
MTSWASAASRYYVSARLITSSRSEAPDGMREVESGVWPVVNAKADLETRGPQHAEHEAIPLRRRSTHSQVAGGNRMKSGRGSDQ